MHEIVGGGEVYHWTAYHLKDSSPEDRGRIKHIFAEPAMILNDVFYKFMGRYMWSTTDSLTLLTLLKTDLASAFLFWYWAEILSRKNQVANLILQVVYLVGKTS